MPPSQTSLTILDAMHSIVSPLENATEELAGYSPWGRKEWDKTEQVSTNLHTETVPPM